MKAPRAAAYAILGYKQFEKDDGLFSALPINVLRKICEILLKSAPEHWSEANAALEEKMKVRCQEPVRKRDHVVFDKYAFKAEIRDAHDFFKGKNYDLAKKSLERAIAIHPTSDFAKKKLEELNKIMSEM